MNTLLIELRTEELPPKALARLGKSFADGVYKSLQSHDLLSSTSELKWFATPRRLAILVSAVLAEASAKKVEEKLMPVSVALDDLGNATPALLKKMAAKNILASEFSHCVKKMDGKAETLFYTREVAGISLKNILAKEVGQALSKLPIPKVMRWGNSDETFVRPVHGLILMHGETIIEGAVLGLQSNNFTLGHRFLSSGKITLKHAEDYEQALLDEGKVIVDFAARKAKIAQALEAKAAELNVTLKAADALLDEVTALTEFPVIYVAKFEQEFLDVPQECLILTMQQNQKYFPLYAKSDDKNGALTNQFLIVSNMQVVDPKHIIEGNAKVIRPRLSDARFFFNQDCKNGFAARADKLNAVIYHNQLGTQGQRAQRLAQLAAKIAGKIGANVEEAKTAGLLCKVDLLTDMVGEFPELQGIMGRYYAQAEGLPSAVCEAMDAHYRPRFAGDILPVDAVSIAVSLADKLDALVGFFGIGQIPTGEKDPFGLRRAALGVLRILIETPLLLDLKALINDAEQGFAEGLFKQKVDAPLFEFISERLRGLLREKGNPPEMIEAVLSQQSGIIGEIPARLLAVQNFAKTSEAQALAAANKRIGNILKKTENKAFSVDENLLQEVAEQALFKQISSLKPLVFAALEKKDYQSALLAVSKVRAEVDQFFTEIMVNVEDEKIRNNRLALLSELASLLNAVANISCLSA